MMLIQNLLEEPEDRDIFFQIVFPEGFGPRYDSSLQILVHKFLSKLDTLIPTPNLAQRSVCSLQLNLSHYRHYCITITMDTILTPMLKGPAAGNYILSSLSFPSSVMEESASCQASSERQSGTTMQGYQIPVTSDDESEMPPVIKSNPPPPKRKYRDYLALKAGL